MAVTTDYADEGNQLTIRISGQFDFSLHREFRDAYRASEHVRRYVVDLGETEYMDSSALGKLLLLREHAHRHNAEVELRRVHGELERVLRIANFHQLFPIHN